jgi:hypothetical protein
MSDISPQLREDQFSFVSTYIRQLDPTATDAAIRRYLSEIEIMAAALDSLEAPAELPIAPFTAAWPDGDDAK